MGHQLDFKDVYPSAFPQTEKSAELHEERKREAREGDGAAATGTHILIGNQAWKVYGMLKDAMENSNYSQARKFAMTLHLVLEDLHKELNT